MSGPMRRGAALSQDHGLNYAAIGASMTGDVIAFPPAGFRAAEYRHRIGSGARRFDLAGRSLMTWGALRGAGFRVDDVRAEPASSSVRGGGPLFLEDGTPWITPGMTARVEADTLGASGPVKVLTVIDEPGRIGFTYGSMHGHSIAGERLLLLEHESDDSVWATVRPIWQLPTSRWSIGARADDKRHRQLDELIVRALHPSYAA